MNDAAIRQLARQAGIAVDWTDAADRAQRVSTPSLVRILGALGLPCRTDSEQQESARRLRAAHANPPLVTATVGTPTPLAGLDRAMTAELVLEDGWRQSLALGEDSLPPVATPGYHRLRYAGREIVLAVAPRRCVTVGDIAGGAKLWGLAVQLYSLRRSGDLGIGDTTGLRALAASAAARGADAVALSPTHSLFPSDPNRYGPYSPSNRLFLNPLLADPADALGAERVVAAAGNEAPQNRPLIDWTEDARAKFDLLLRLYNDFAVRDLAPRTPLAGRYKAFVADRGTALEKHASFEAEKAGGTVPTAYFLFLQWVADVSFARAQADARAAGMRIGLISDLAVGLDRGGSQVAADPADFLSGLTVGAPPDLFNPKGQDWGLTSFSPQALVESGFDSFIATLRATLRHAGGVRIDHAMGLKRLWLVPEGASPAEGAYLAYPLDDLMRLLALESHRHRAVVIGEDLGTVPPDFRQRCREIGLAGMDVLWFQRDGRRFQAPEQWRDDAVAMTSTHDLPTVAGWWQGADLDLRRGLGLVKEGDSSERDEDRRALWRTFVKAKVARGGPPAPTQTASVVDAAMGFVARAPDPLALVPLEDIIGTVEQPNLPGTVGEHPNWRRRFARPAAELLDEPAAARRLDILREGRK
jgi:4-alpha-glucanotransferase